METANQYVDALEKVRIIIIYLNIVNHTYEYKYILGND
jgi:hypothetical protein